MLENITSDAKRIVSDLLKAAKLEKGDILVVGCSSSEILGDNPGTNSSPDIAKATFEGIYPLLQEQGIYIAAQCCEHLNRAIVIEKEAARKYGLEVVNVVPQPKAGGSFATCTYNNLECPVVVDEIKAQAGIDIGGVLIGMHLKRTAVPVAVNNAIIGKARVICARTRPRFVGGERAVYDADLL
ncbi:MAG TPA: TIGR01440 family protein [Clostridiales bacterium]|nr:TIGR01440 family protein [Clostridiales bacterium]